MWECATPVSPWFLIATPVPAQTPAWTVKEPANTTLIPLGYALPAQLLPTALNAPQQLCAQNAILDTSRTAEYANYVLSPSRIAQHAVPL